MDRIAQLLRKWGSGSSRRWPHLRRVTQRLIDIDGYARFDQERLVERTLEVSRIVLIALVILVGIVIVIVLVLRWATSEERYAHHPPPIFLPFDDPDQPPLAPRPSHVARRPSGHSPSEPSSPHPLGPVAYGTSSASSSRFAPPTSPTGPSSSDIGIAVPSVGPAGAAASAALAPKQPPVIHPPTPSVSGPTQLRVVRDYPSPELSMLQGEPVSDETVRFRRPSDEPVQLLPGRLEVLSGDARHREIRFVRVPGRPAELILGREPGDSPQHVALRSTTVSRQHARFSFLDGRWTVMNLSRTNPIVINGTELSSSDASYVLRDGDRLELGEVVLCFHAH